MVTALTIAGSDSGGGAGIQADLRTFAAHHVFGTTAVTAITAQNTLGIRQILALPPAIVVEQIDAILADFHIEAVKIGMLVNEPIVRAVADALRRHRPKHIVLDPIIRSSSGTDLLDRAGVEAMRAHLLPLVDVVTPNLSEAEVLSGVPVKSIADARVAAAHLIVRGARAVVVTGGHLDGDPSDLVHNGREIVILEGARLDASHTHGTGCTFASALASRLALGDAVIDAARAAKSYVTRAIAQAPHLGRGRGPLEHFPKPGLDS